MIILIACFPQTGNTVKAHTRDIHGKLGVHNRTQAAARASALGVLPSTWSRDTKTTESGSLADRGPLFCCPWHIYDAASLRLTP